MKYSFMSFSTPELGWPETLEVARRYGYEGIEPRLDAGHAHGVEVDATPAERAAVRKRAADAGIAVACLATSLHYADPADTEDMLRGTRERIDLAGDVGAKTIRVFGGAFPGDVSREQAIDLMAGSLGKVADHAAGRGVTLCLETHDAWCDPRHVAEVLRRADHPAVSANWDIMHPVRAGHATIDESFEALKPWIRHLHLHDGGDDGLAPIGEGPIDHRRAIELLMTIGFDGYLSGEWIDWEPCDVHLPRELATLKAYERELA